VTINYSPLTIHRSKSTSVFALITTNVTELASSGLKPVTELFNQFVLFRSARKSHFFLDTSVGYGDAAVNSFCRSISNISSSFWLDIRILGYWDITVNFFATQYL